MVKRMINSDIQFTVVIPAHNSAKWLGEALDSVYKQSYEAFEIYVFNDSSHDSLDCVKEKYPQVIYKEVKYGNAAAARNEILKYVKGTYIAFLDSDDRWLNDKLSNVAEVILETPELVGYLNSFNYIDIYGNITDRICKWGLYQPVSMGSFRYIDFLQKNKYFVGMSACVVKTSVFKKIGGFDPTFKRRHDIEMWLRVISEGLVTIDPRKTSLYRKNVPSSLSSNNSETEYFKFMALRKNFNLFLNSPGYLKLIRQAAISALNNAILYGKDEFRFIVFQNVKPFFTTSLKIAFSLGIFWPKSYKTIYRLIR